MKNHISCYKNIFERFTANMTSHDTGEVILGRVDDLTHNAKADGNICRFLSKFQNILVLELVDAVYSLEETTTNYTF